MVEKTILEKLEGELREFCDNELIFIPKDKSILDVIREKDRRQEYVKLREFVVKKLRNEKKWSFPRIGRFLNKYHTSAVHLYYK